MVTFFDRHASEIYSAGPENDSTAMSTPNISDKSATAKIVTLKLEAVDAKKTVEALRARVHATKESLKLARKELKEAKIQAKRARKTLKAEKKLAKQGVSKTGAKKRKQPVAKKSKPAA